jgi:uncharacterized protein involved in outer membrane biogenesis
MSSATRASRLRRVALWATGILALLILTGFFIVPPVAKSLIVKQAGKALGREVSIDRLAVNPFALSATVSGVRLYEAGSKEVFASLDELYVNVESSSIWNLAPVVGALKVSAPKVKIVRLPGDRFNFSDILETLASQPKSEGKARFSLNNIELADGRIDIDDRVEGATHEVTGIRLGIPFVSNLPSKVALKVTPAFAASFNGTTIALQGETTPFQDTLESSLRLSLDGLALGRYLRYAPATLGFSVPTGTLDSDLRLYFIRAPGEPQRLTLSGTARVRDLSVVDAARAPLLALPLLEVDIESIDVFARDIDISKIAVNGLSVDIVRERDGMLNLLALLPRPAAAKAGGSAGPAPVAGSTEPVLSPPGSAEGSPPPAAALPGQALRYSVNAFTLDDGRIVFTDRSLAAPFRTELTDLDVAVMGLNNKRSEPAQVSASIRTGFGETLSAKAAVSLAPAGAEGSVDLSGVRPRNYAPYYAPRVRFEIDDAKVDLSTRFRVAQGADGLAASLEALSLSVADLRTRRSGDKEALVNLKSIAVKDVAIDISRRAATIGELSARDALIRIDRASDGRLNLASLLTDPDAAASTPSPAVAPQGLSAAGAGAAGPAPAGQPWTWALRRAAIERFNVRFDDRVPASPVAIELSDIAASIEDLNSTRGSRANATLRLSINRSGSLSAKGRFALDPMAGSFDIDARSIAVLPLQPYFTEKLNVVITGGEVSARGAVSADTSATPLRAGFVGEASIANFAALERLTDQELLRWKSLFFGGIDVTASPARVSIGEIALSEFFARIILSEKGRLNLQDLVRADAAPGAPTPGATPSEATSAGAATSTGAVAGTGAGATSNGPKPPVPAAAPLPLNIGRISLASGNIDFTDLFVRPNFRLNLTGMTGSVSTLTSEPGSAADLELRGQLDGSAPVEIVGRLNPIATPLLVDIKGAVRGVELSTLSPYSTKYTGYGIERGRLTLNIAYKVDGRKVDAEHRIFLDQLTFSTERIEGPAVVRLPILFAVRLLQNRRGEIDLNLPISGTLDDPKFRIGPIIWQVVVNLITRAVTAPFSLLASLGGGSGEELSTVEFESGRAVLSDAARKRLALLGKALSDRPSLRLELAGHADAERDREGFRRMQLETAVRAQKARDLARKGESVAALDAVKLDPKEYETFLRAAYREAKFPKPRNAVGMLRELPVPEMETLMLTHVTVTADDLRQLATARARAVETYLIKETGLSPERVFLVQAKPAAADGEASKAMLPPARVDMAIR